MSKERLPLDSLQGWMQNALILPRQASREETERIVAPSDRLSAAQRLAIYQRSYYLRILKCMEEQFPALCHALGMDLFREFARQYLVAHPSRSYTLYELGSRFPAYLETTRPDREQKQAKREHWIDFMVDLARFERKLFVMFDAPGHEGKPFAEEHVPDSRLRLQPCFAICDYRFPVAWYYHEVRQGNDPPFPPQARTPVALVRKDYRTHTFPLTSWHYLFLTALDRGKSILEAHRLVAAESGQPFDEVCQSWAEPQGTRQRWIEAGFFIAADD